MWVDITSQAHHELIHAVLLPFVDNTSENVVDGYQEPADVLRMAPPPQMQTSLPKDEGSECEAHVYQEPDDMLRVAPPSKKQTSLQEYKGGDKTESEAHVYQEPDEMLRTSLKNE